METRARYVLIGIFTLASILATLGFLLWLAKVQLDRTYAEYDILFTSVEGLGRASPVRYNGVDVGEVLNIAVDAEDPSLVRVRIQLAATTPVRTDTKAQVASQGVTGVSYVSLSGGAAPEPLTAEGDQWPPVIPLRAIGRSGADGGRADAARRGDRAPEGYPDLHRPREPRRGREHPDERRCLGAEHRGHHPRCGRSHPRG